MSGSTALWLHLEHVLKINPNYRDAAEIKEELASLK
jgi:hypothetical protein